MRRLLTLLLLAATTSLGAAPAFPLKVSADGRTLTDAAGAPFFYHADTTWALTRNATLAEADEYFALRAKDGFTAIHLHAVTKEVGPVKNVNGDEPFAPLDDILKPNEAYWRHLDGVLEATEKRGLLAAVSALWIRWGGRDKEGWRNQLTEANAGAYGEFLGKRYAARKNVMWILGGDDNPHEDRAAIALMARALKETAPHHLITVHNQPEHSSASFFANEPWLDVNAAYTYREVAPHVLAEWERPFAGGKPKPIFLIESGYEHESNDSRGGAAHRVRRQAYSAILSGALMGHAYGHREVWRFSGKWREGVADVGSKQMRHVRDLFATRAWWELRPDTVNELVPSRVDRVSPGDEKWPAAARAEDGSFALVYLPASRPVVVDTAKVAAGAKARWFDPTDGSTQPASGKPWRETPWLEFTPPAKNASGDEDFVLILATARAETQQPKPDYSAPADAPYTAEDVAVKTPAGHTLAGTLTLPKAASGAQPVGAIVTITGSGPQDRDEALGLEGFRPFRQIADALARRGIAVLRMDDRGTGASGGTFKGSTSADFAEDVRAGLAYLRTRSEVRADRLGVLGHSEGAVIAPMVAEKEPALCAIVLLAGVAQPARSALHFQMKNGYEHDTKLTPEKREAAIAAIPTKIDAMMAADPWMKFFLTHDPAATMRRVKTPVLILTGARDQQAAPEQVALMEAAFKEGGNTDVTARVLPDLNHLFVHDTDGFPKNYAKLPPPVMMQADAVELITGWLAQRLR